MHFRKRLLSLVLSLVLVLPITLLLSPAPVVSAETTSTLYGTGSADEINIVKLLDMALNKGGVSMSPATIRAFLEFWWSSVHADLSTCINNADAAITTTQDFVDYVCTALEDTEHYNQLGDIIKRYVRYVVALEGKSLSDIKQLLLQPGTFRQFLLSYVTDQDGNIVNTVDNKIKKYNIGKDFVNMTRKAADAYIEEYEGYYLLKTHKPSEILPAFFTTKTQYDITVNIFKGMTNDMVIIPLYTYSSGNGTLRFYDVSDGTFVFSGYADNPNIRRDTYFCANVYDDNWEFLKSPYMTYRSFFDGSTQSWLDYDFTVLDIKSSDNLSTLVVYPLKPDQNVCTNPVYSGSSYSIGWIFTSDARMVKVWKSLDAYKGFSAGKENVYYASSYSSYDSSIDNSVEFSGSYYNSNSYSHDVIQQAIDNSETVDNSTINNIVNNYITNNNYGDSSGSGSGSGSGDSSGSNDWWNIGDGITAFVKGIAALLDFLLKLLGDLIGVISDFLVGLLEILKNLGVVGSSFGDFLSEFFGFLPDEIIAAIVSGIGLMVVAGVIKVFKK